MTAMSAQDQDSGFQIVVVYWVVLTMVIKELVSMVITTAIRKP